MTIAKYLRISDEDRDIKRTGKEESDSIGNQRNLLESFIGQHEEFVGAENVEFCDDGWSGKNFERPGVRAMLEQVKHGKIQCILVKDISRFGRDYLMVGNYISKIFPFMGVRFIAVNDGIDSARPGDVDSLDTSFKTLLYDLYSRDLSRKIKSAKRLRAQRGDFLSPFAPYGYMKSPENHSVLLPDPQAAETVRRVFHLAAEGYSTTAIARMMNAEAVPTHMLYKRASGCSRSGWPSVSENNFWTKNTVIILLRDERYVGSTIYGKRVRDCVGSPHTVKVSRDDWVIVQNAHEPIVTQEEFNRAQAAIRVFREHSYHVSDHPLARKVRCGICGYALTRSGSRNKSYSCQTHKFVENMECMDVHVSEDGLWAAILESLRAQAVIALDRERFVLEQRKTMQQQLDSVRKRLLALHEKQERCSRESRELYETFAMGSLNRVDYLVQKSALTEKKTEIAQQISELQKVLDSQNEKSSDQFVDIFKPFWDVKDIPDEAFKDLLKEVKVFPGNRLAVVWNCQDALAVKSDGTP